MKAVILVGGEGIRLRPLTVNIPKAMVPILNRPFLEHVIEYLKRYGINHIILALGYLPTNIQEYFGAGRGGSSLTYMVEVNPLGTAGAVKNAESYLDGPFFVLNGDIFTDLDLGAMMAFHRQRGAQATIALTPVDDPTIYGVVETDSDGRVQRFIEKPSREAVTTNMINAGIYILEPETLEHVPRDTHYMFERGLFPLLLEQGQPVYGYPFNGYWMDMGTPEKYLRLHHDLLQNGARKGTALGEGCHIHPTAEIDGPVLMGRACSVGPRAKITGPAVLGDGCQIGEEVAIDGAVLWPQVHIGKAARLKDCIVAANCSLGSRCWVVEGCVLGEGVVVSEGCRLGQAQQVWPGKKLEPGTLSF